MIIFTHDTPYYKEKAKQLKDFICDYGVSDYARSLKRVRALNKLQKALGVIFRGGWNCRHKVVPIHPKDIITMPPVRKGIEGIDWKICKAVNFDDEDINPCTGKPRVYPEDGIPMFMFPEFQKGGELHPDSREPIVGGKTVGWIETKDGIQLIGDLTEKELMSYAIDLSENKPLSCHLDIHFTKRVDDTDVCMYCGTIIYG